MTWRVLVAYGSKSGSTAEMAQWIVEELRSRHLDAEARPAAEVRGLGGYDAVVLGGALYMGRWHRDAVRFTRRHAEALTELPVWLFSSGPLQESAADRDIPPVRGALRAADRVDSREHVTFGGRLTEDARGRIARQLLKQGRGGDYRDEARVRRWAQGIATELVSGPSRLP